MSEGCLASVDFLKIRSITVIEDVYLPLGNGVASSLRGNQAIESIPCDVEIALGYSHRSSLQGCLTLGSYGLKDVVFYASKPDKSQKAHKCGYI